MANTFFQLIQPTAWSQIVDVIQNRYVHVEGEYSFYYIYAEDEPTAVTKGYLVEGNRGNDSNKPLASGYSLGSMWVKSVNQVNNTLKITLGDAV
jgi:hypothetical protein